MKKLFTLTILLCVGLSFSQAQENWCFTDEHNYNLEQQRPELIPLRNQMEEKRRKLLQQMSYNDKSGEVLIVPTVVHVIHEFGAENIDKSEVEEFIRIMNEDYRRINADTSDTRSVFKSIAADSKIEFRLAKIDPNGNCTDGTVRVRSEMTNSADDAVKSVSYWPSDQYFNVWSVATIEGSGGGTTLGYAQFPGWGDWSTYGFVSRADALATRTATHEAGHCFGLFHTFQGGCGSSCEDSGDDVCDTPPVPESTWSCNFVQNTCSNDASGGDTVNVNPYTEDVEDQIENYMSYDDCQNMFTIGQSNRMTATINTYNELINLTSEANIIATGVDSGNVCNPIPVVDFYMPYEYTCTNLAVNIMNNTYNYNEDDISFSWELDDTVEVDNLTVKEPLVSWSISGKYDIKLNASTAGGTSSKTKISEAKVLSGTAIDPFSESFTSVNFPHNNINDPTTSWFVDGLTNDNSWKRFSGAGTDGNTCAMLDIKNTSGVHRLITPMIDMTQANCDSISFDLAYAVRFPNANERFTIRYSTTCGRTWPDANILFQVSGNDISPYTQTSDDFIPSNGDWKRHSINASKLSNKDDVLIMFELNIAAGNSLYMDNVVFGCNERVLSSVNNEVETIGFDVYPNPVSYRNAMINISSSGNLNGYVVVTDLTGKTLGSKKIKIKGQKNVLISSIVNTELINGVYLVSFVSEKQTSTKKVVID